MAQSITRRYSQTDQSGSQPNSPDDVLRFLLVTRDEHFVETVQALLREQPTQIIRADSAETADRHLQEHATDILVLEVPTGHQDTLDFVHSVQRTNPDVPVILLTEHITLSVSQRALKEGVFDLLGAPFDHTELQLTLTRAMESRRLAIAKNRLLEDSRDRNFELSRRVAELNALADAAAALSSSGDISHLLSMILNLATKVTLAQAGSVMLLDDHAAELIIKAMVGPLTERLLNKRLPIGESIAGWVAERGEALKIDDVESDAQFGRVNRQRFETKSLLSVPLRAPNRIVGVINLSDKQGGQPFTDWDLRILKTFAAQAAMAINDAEQFEKNRRKLAEVTTLYDISRRVSTATKPEDIARTVFDGLDKIIDCELKIWFELDAESGELVAVATDSSVGELRHQSRISLDHWEGDPQDEDAFARREMLSAIGVLAPNLKPESLLIAPVGDDATGAADKPSLHAVIALVSTRPNAFDSYTERLVRLAAAQAGALYERKSALLNASRLVTMGKMISEISHDLRKPLTNIKGPLQIIRSKRGVDQKTAEILESTEQEIDRLAELVNELVDFSNPMKYQTHRRPLKPVVDRAVRMVAKDASDKRISVEVDFSEELPPVFHDENQILEVCLNLILNAFESMERGGTLCIRGTVKDTEAIGGAGVCLEFKDTGCGIPKEELPRIFDRYYTRREGGTGLGLAIVERIVQAHAGIIEVDSSSKGTTFRLLFPLAA